MIWWEERPLLILDTCEQTLTSFLVQDAKFYYNDYFDMAFKTLLAHLISKTQMKNLSVVCGFLLTTCCTFKTNQSVLPKYFKEVLIAFTIQQYKNTTQFRSLRDCKEWKLWGWKDFLKKDGFKLWENHGISKPLFRTT